MAGKIAPLVGIMGSGRSGSTLLEYLLAGYIRDARPLGEVESLVVRSARDNEPCSCGLPATRCPRWATVTDQLAVHPLRTRWECAIENRHYRLRWGLALCAVALSRRLTSRPTAPRAAADCYVPLFDALAEISTGATILIDNSKTPLHFFALAAAGCQDLRIVHILRRPQAVAWSWRRRKHLPESGDKNWYMEPKPVRSTAMAWLFDTLLAVLFHTLYPTVHYIQISYDELCSDPAATVTRCVRGLELTPAPTPGRPTDYHVLGGNPARFGGFDRIELDDEWRANLSLTARVLLALTAAPVYRLLLRTATPGGRTRGKEGRADI